MKFKNVKTNDSYDEKTLRKIKTLWIIREKDILNSIKQITGWSINTEKIMCYLDNKATNGSYGSRTIYLGIKGGVTKDDALMVISHELFHIFYWRKIKKIKLTTSSPGNESKEEWKLAEVAAFLLTNESNLKKNWPNAKVYLYPEIKEVYKKVRKFWKKGDIKYFLVNSYKTIKN